MWQKYFIVIILFCLYACKGERKEQNTNSTIIEKKWAKDCSNDSKIHVLSSNAQFANGEKSSNEQTGIYANDKRLHI